MTSYKFQVNVYLKKNSMQNNTDNQTHNINMFFRIKKSDLITTKSVSNQNNQRVVSSLYTKTAGKGGTENL